MQGHHSRHMTPNGRGLGWRPELGDHRDLYFATSVSGAALPPSVDLESKMPPVYDQGQLGSCTANAIAAALQYERMRQSLSDPADVLTPSRLMIYYEERELEGTVGDDAGAQIRDGIKCVATSGACFEEGPNSWPYDISKFTVKPPPDRYQAAVKDRALRYKRVLQLAQQLRGALAQGVPVIFGFTCYSGLDSDQVANGGTLPMPSPGEAPIGGHAVLAVGYDDAHRLVKVRNSWSAGWGLKGYFHMPYEYLLRRDLAQDFWMIEVVG